MTVHLFKALSDETRLRLLRILIDHKLSVNELVSILEMGQSRISRHLRILTEAGLLTSRRDGLWVFYQANSEGEHNDFLSAITPYLKNIPEAAHDDERTMRLVEEKQAKSRQFFNDIAEDWDILNKEILGDFDLPGRVFEAMPERCHLAVDLGCGTGSVMRQMLGRADGVIGVDISSGMLDACRRTFADVPDAEHRISLRIGEMEHLPLRDQEADFASVNLVLHHLPRPELALPEIRRILSPSGRLFISDFEKHSDEYMRERYGDLWLGFDPMKLAVTLREAGFSRTTIHKQKVNRNLTLILITSYVSAPVSRPV
ncbi:MAG: metalloregulator ArsR/SmtB family transcription factor [Desulfovibrionaceae bacterium]|nr:metalloregulator ArsR/SmtB family transcription factor [Desulfovibrionaceae bacterium]